MNSVETYDIVMVAVVLAFTCLGAVKGLAWQVASLASLVVSYCVAYRFRQPLAAWIPLDPPWDVFLAMLVLFVATSLVIWIAFRYVREFIDRMKMKEFDRQIGALFGFLKGLLMCVVVTLVAIALVGEEQRKAVARSYSGRAIASLVRKCHEVIPDELFERLEPYLREVSERLEPGAAGEQGGSAEEA